MMRLGSRIRRDKGNVAASPAKLGEARRINDRLRLKNIQRIINEIIQGRAEDKKHVFIDDVCIKLQMPGDAGVIMLLESFYKDAGWSDAAWDSERGGLRLTV